MYLDKVTTTFRFCSESFVRMSSENVSVQLQASSSRREEFQKYLERTGVTKVLSDLLMSLYKRDERPDDVFEYIRKYLSDYRRDPKSLSNVENLRRELIDAKTKVKDLKKRINKLENKAVDDNQSNNVNVPK